MGDVVCLWHIWAVQKFIRRSGLKQTFSFFFFFFFKSRRYFQSEPSVVLLDGPRTKTCFDITVLAWNKHLKIDRKIRGIYWHTSFETESPVVLLDFKILGSIVGYSDTKRGRQKPFFLRWNNQTSDLFIQSTKECQTTL